MNSWDEMRADSANAQVITGVFISRTNYWHEYMQTYYNFPRCDSCTESLNDRIRALCMLNASHLVITSLRDIKTDNPRSRAALDRTIADLEDYRDDCRELHMHSRDWSEPNACSRGHEYAGRLLKEYEKHYQAGQE